MHSSRKIGFCTSENKGKERKKLDLIAKYQIGEDNWIDYNSLMDGNFFNENFTVEANELTEYTQQVWNLYFKKCGCNREKTDFDCQF
jgi:hypothetical protein